MFAILKRSCGCGGDHAPGQGHSAQGHLRRDFEDLGSGRRRDLVLFRQTNKKGPSKDCTNRSIDPTTFRVDVLLQESGYHEIVMPT